ncbi:UDP-N-acetylenolpyruvoylglucosamine reductase [Candidatus Falkowbacteria bacterium CG_4_9_14_3_um_filter_36_9]|uniref:UDP-N-acetylenolpyruvoylglucosamine reductase n=2 Tax=Candidatus Falkowiibacteriota TaxID=1752728 RepID=A0A1J4T818_9BACT|nr:MAG: UDP-N-acetylenolpyruvoylglucosamine reductase [Candidatus Falkowbacteria bacterium CG1_02_37_44]PIV51849.1 MAG: UDP-N-acetylenolpyruvoylglucosamine reductase [Candidatus Falkowbacteria bacterium CG02_land_8_20_14_3_00_36_14]PIX11140.1 MAG: UDP-N-acetylenolpyruvoylglucosamine reductase [Candidatus Falkowbacteria bacterium CG_4_8_14_3_um_filter_36_11]PJA11110.1 MAG: UDP-N-acetylenolpyruvoylglucosamine reductase [Candidatus Falkowbacteria bacterium CG_4_10_14_0_2_um_filter_36_22]PJB17924.1
MIENKLRQNVILAPLTTFKIGGPAEYFIEVISRKDLEEAVCWAKDHKKPLTILAGGSNVLINNLGVKGLVIKIYNKNIKVMGIRLNCEAGALLSKAIITAVANNLTDLEWAAGIPGTIGGAIRGNAGSYDNTIGKFIETVEVYNITKNNFFILSRNDCQFEYRGSIFKNNHSLIIWQAIIKLRISEKDKIKNLISKYTDYRIKTQVQPRLPSAGSIFKNITLEEFKKCNQNLAFCFEKEKGAVRNGMIGTGWLIDALGIKGKTIGGAKISLEHGNFIVNTGKATALDVIALISYIKQQVRDKLKVQLIEEIQYVGF